MNYYNIRNSLNNPHLDLLHFARRAWRNELPNFKLVTLESHLGVKRKLDIPGELIPEFYDTYLKTKNTGLLIPIVEHNRHDIVTLVRIFNELGKIWNKYDK